MQSSSNLDRVRGEALNRLEQAERLYKTLYGVAIGVEALFLVSFLLLMDVHNRTHVLLLVASMLVESTVCAGLLIVGSYVSLSTQRVLKALDLMARERDAA